jgi:hypothetical protein
MADVESDADNLSFRDQHFLSNFQLNGANALDYFRLSPFYTPTCDNEVVRMQGLPPDSLLSMTGVQFSLAAVTTEKPVAHVIIVRKERRLSPERAVALDYYYILHGTLYKAPSLQEVLTARLAAASESLATCLSLLVECVDYAPGTGYTWSPSTLTPTTARPATNPTLFPPAPELVVDDVIKVGDEKLPQFDEAGVNVAVRRLLADTAADRAARQ